MTISFLNKEQASGVSGREQAGADAVTPCRLLLDRTRPLNYPESEEARQYGQKLFTWLGEQRAAPSGASTSSHWTLFNEVTQSTEATAVPVPVQTVIFICRQGSLFH